MYPTKNASQCQYIVNTFCSLKVWKISLDESEKKVDTKISPILKIFPEILLRMTLWRITLCKDLTGLTTLHNRDDTLVPVLNESQMLDVFKR